MSSPHSGLLHKSTPFPTSISEQSVLQNGSPNVALEPPTNGERRNGDANPIKPADLMHESKLKAKAVLAASRPLAYAESIVKVSSAGHEISGRREGTPDGMVYTRKRSRSGTRIPRPVEPPKTPDKARQSRLLRQYVARELAHTAAISYDCLEGATLLEEKIALESKYKEVKEQRLKSPAKTAAALFGYGYAGYGNGTTSMPGGGSVVVYPAQRRRVGGRKSRELRIPKKDLATQSEQLDELVPVRLDIEWDKIRLRDTFTWNLHDRVISPELFAEHLVEDFKLPPDQYALLVQLVCSSIREQIQDFHPQVFIDEESLDPHLPYHAYKDDEMRILIKLNITIGQHTLVDQFEWEINNPLNSAEEFARQMTRDLCLTGEFTTAIAHSIREQSQLFTRSLYVTGHPFDGRPVEDQELKAGFLSSPLPSTFRSYQAAKEFTPYLYELNEADLEKTELSLSREERRQKRSVTRRGGPALPDLKDRRRTIRTLVVSSVLPGAAETIEDSRIFKRTAAPANTAGRTRRPGQGHKEGLDDSDDSESENSSGETPAVTAHQLSGTARTRGMRGAVTAAQAALRGHAGRSATPEISTLHHHETRTSGRRFGGSRDYREESVDDSPTMLVKLRLNRERFKQLLRDQKLRTRPEPLHMTSSTSHPSTRRSQSATPGLGTPAVGAMGPPPSTPGAQHQTIPRTPGSAAQPPRDGQPSAAGGQPNHPHAAQIGRVDALGPPSQENPIVSR